MKEFLKFTYDGDVITKENILEFVKDFNDGKLKRHLKS